MNHFIWTTSYETGIKEVDHQHKHLVDIINQLGEKIVHNDINKSDFENLYKELVAYSHIHFRDEEALMENLNVDERHVNLHKMIHSKFMNGISVIFDAINIENQQQAKGFLDYLVHWLGSHILGTDQAFANQISAIKSGMSPEKAFEKFEVDNVSPLNPLLDAFASLFEQIAEDNRLLQELNASLEDKVKARTEELQIANAKLKSVSETDVLTNLPNRRFMLISLREFWLEAEEEGLPLSCVMVDADYFKRVNDDCGHDAGDIVLKELANTLRDSFRNSDQVCRLGGDEFFVICPNTNLTDTKKIANEVKQKVNQMRVSTGGDPWVGSISVGVATKSAEVNTIDLLMKEADISVYQAKEAGRNCVCSNQR